MRKSWILAAATLLLVQGADAREHNGPPPACPQPKADCKPKCPPKPCKASKPCGPSLCNPPPCKPVCCPPVCFERSFPTSPCCTPSAYSEPANVTLDCGYDISFDASFIYWEAIQGGMELAVPAMYSSTVGSVRVNSDRHSALEQNSTYNPGFKVGAAWTGGKDNWSVSAEYTWLHGSTSTSRFAPASTSSTTPTGVWQPTSWMLPNNNTSGTIASYIQSDWNYRFDILDAQLARPFYSGARLTLEPFFGLRSAWFRQGLELRSTLATLSGVRGAQTATYDLHASAVGPRMGLNGNWLLGCGFRFMGDMAASLLFTGYDVHQVVGPSGTSGDPARAEIENFNALRPNLDLSLGIGWGSYFGCRRYYWDLAASYDFSVFWSQNMMRYLADMANNNIGASPADLYLHGLTIKTRFDF